MRGFAALLYVLAGGDTEDLYSQSLKVVAVTFGASAVLTLVASRARHLAWIVFPGDRRAQLVGDLGIGISLKSGLPRGRRGFQLGGLTGQV